MNLQLQDLIRFTTHSSTLEPESWKYYIHIIFWQMITQRKHECTHCYDDTKNAVTARLVPLFEPCAHVFHAIDIILLSFLDFKWDKCRCWLQWNMCHLLSMFNKKISHLHLEYKNIDFFFYTNPPANAITGHVLHAGFLNTMFYIVFPD